MIRLVDVDEENFLDIVRLRVEENQTGFLDSAQGILARGYVYRKNRARVIGIAYNQKIVGVALVKDMDEEPACYDLQQFMIDRNFQNKGYGTQSLRQILFELEQERKYNCVEVCVKQNDAQALRVYEKAGFQDTGYIDERVPDCFNLVYYFKNNK